jgi:hypothetical protein
MEGLRAWGLNSREARSSVYYQVSTELAARKNVDMERAKSHLEEHQLACLSAASINERYQGPET